MDGFKIGSSVDTCTAEDLELVLTEPPGDRTAGAGAAAVVALAGRFLESTLVDRELEPEDQTSLEVGGGGKC